MCLLCIQEEQEACKKTGRVINFSLIAELQFQKWDDLVKKIAEIEKGNMGNMTAMQQVEQFQICSHLFSGCYCQYGKYGQHAFQTAGKLHIQKISNVFQAAMANIGNLGNMASIQQVKDMFKYFHNVSQAAMGNMGTMNNIGAIQQVKIISLFISSTIFFRLPWATWPWSIWDRKSRSCSLNTFCSLL